MSKIPNGYYVTIHRSLTEPQLWAGVPRDLMILNATFGMAIGIMLKMYFLLIINLLIHILARRVTKSDKHFFSALKKHKN